MHANARSPIPEPRSNLTTSEIDCLAIKSVWRGRHFERGSETTRIA